jgi:hypothetical protein
MSIPDPLHFATELGLELPSWQEAIFQRMFSPARQPRKGGKVRKAREMTELTARLGRHVHVTQVDPGLAQGGSWCVTWQEGIKSYLYVVVRKPSSPQWIYDEVAQLMNTGALHEHS